MNSDRPLRFCMITTFYPPYNFGGDGIFVQRLSNELARRGHHVEVIHSIDAYRLRAGEPTERNIESHPNVVVHGLTSPSPFFSALAHQQIGAPHFYATQIQRILQQGFDVINFHNVSLMGGPHLLHYGQGVKLYNTHEYWLVCPTHVLYQYNRKACTQPHCFLCSLTYRRPPQAWRYTDLLSNACRHVDTFIAPSRFSIDIHYRFGFEGSFAQIPYFAPDVELAPRSEHASPYFLFVGRLEKLKGAHTLIPVFRAYPRARLLIAGRGDAESELRKAARDCSNIEFLGQLSDHQLQGLYRNAVATVVPSLCYEAFPNVILESFRQQTPIIVRNIGALPEIAKESRGGVIYDSDQELIDELDRLMDNRAAQRDLGLRGYMAYREKWTADAYLDRYLGLVHALELEKQSTALRENTPVL